MVLKIFIALGSIAERLAGDGELIDVSDAKQI
jgi:hypothetical protein